MSSKKAETVTDEARQQIILERTFDAAVEDVWELWTTAEGIESWWGPDGFIVKVRRLDLRPGGELLYAMIAVAEETIAFMKQAGMPTSTETRLRYVEIVPLVRLAYTNIADFIPGVAAYDVGHVLELYPQAGKVRMVLRLDPMHDDVWNQRMVAGWEMELGKLEKQLAARR